MSSRPHLLRLPIEVQTDVLQCLDHRVLRACMTTCRQLRSLICDASALQYELTLASSGMCDGPVQSRLTAAERLARLKTHEDAWRGLSWKEETSWIIPSPYRIATSGGIFVALFRESSRLILKRPPSTLRGVAAIEWELNLPCVPRDVCIDACQDLLVIVDISGNVHLLSLLRGHVHPQASPEVNFPSHLHDGSMRIFGNYLGLYNGVYRNRCTIKNWKTGATELHSCNFGNFCFLDDKHILAISDTSKYYWAVHIYEYPVKYTCAEGISLDPPLAIFFFPPISPDTAFSYVLYDSGTTPDRSEGYFHADDAEKMIYVRISFLEERQDADGRRISHITEESVLAVPSRTFLSCLDERSRWAQGSLVKHVPWETWGPARTFAFGGPSERCVIAAGSSGILGTRCVVVNKDLTPASIEVLDFHPARIAAVRRRVSKTPGGPFAVRDWSRLDATARGWEIPDYPSESDVESGWGLGKVDPGLTKLSCIVSRRTLPSTLDHDGGSVLLTEDAILCVPPVSLAGVSGEKLEIRVFGF